MRVHASLVLAALLLPMVVATLTSSGIRAQADPEALFRQYHDTLNRGDVSGALAFFTDDGTFETAVGTLSGQAVRKQHEDQVSQDRQVNILSTEVSGSTLTARVEVRANQITACGAERIVATETATFSGDKISRLVFQEDPSDPQTATVLACIQALRVPATGGAPPAAAGGGIPLAVLLGAALFVAGGLVITLGLKRRS